MTTYYVFPKTDTVRDSPVFIYSADAPIEWRFYEFTDFDHVAQATTPPSGNPVLTQPYSNLIDIGAFFDRFGAAKMAVLTSTDIVVKAIVQDSTVRKWIDLSRPDVAQAVEVLSQKVPSVTPEVKANVLRVPVEDHENLALRITYFGGSNG